MVAGKIGKVLHNSAARLLLPDLKNRVVLYYWSPGYKVQKASLNHDGREEIRKVFVPTTSFEMALRDI